MIQMIRKDLLGRPLAFTALSTALLLAACGNPTAMTMPNAAVSPATVDFGKTGCGVKATTKTVTLANAGSAELTFTAAVTDPGYTVDKTSGTVAAGESATLTVSLTVPGTATAGAAANGTLKITTNDTAHASIDVPLTATAAGGYLTVSPTPVSLGLLPVGSVSSDIPVTVTNTGNQAISLKLEQPSDTQFSINWNDAPNNVMLAPGATVQGLVARFTPANIMPSTGAAALSTTDPICNTTGNKSAASIAITGQGTNGVVTITPQDVFFGTGGNVPCGTTATAKTFEIKNNGNAAFSWVAVLNKGSSSPFTFTPMSGTIPKGASVTVTVTPAAGIPAAADTTLDAFGDAIQLTTDIAGDTPHTITLHQTAYGVVLSFAPAMASFGNVPVMTTSDVPFTVGNAGSAEAHVTLASSNGSFTVAPAGPTTVAGGTTTMVTATFAPGSNVTPQTANITATLDKADPLCAPLPAPMVLTGTGTNGTVSLSPAALDFGLVPCGTKAAAKTVTFKNPGNADYTITPTLDLGNASPYTITMNPTTGIAAKSGGMVVITVTPKAIPATSAVTPDLYSDTLTVTTTVTSDMPHKIPLRQTASGSIFAISATSLDFGTVVVGSSGKSTFAVSNSGNLSGTVKFATQNQVFMIPDAVVPAGGSYNDIASYTPTLAGPVSDTATLSVTTGTVLCAPLPFTSMPLKGTGSVSNVLLVSAGSLTFGAGGLVDCGSTAPPQTVTVTNTSAQTLTMKYTLQLGNASPYTVTGPMTLAPKGQSGDSGTVTITPKAIPTTASTAPDAFADSLKINGTGGPINEDHAVSLRQTARGAILSFNPTALTFGPIGGLGGGNQSKAFTVNNAGNLAAPYTLAVAGTDANRFSVTPTAGTAAGGGGSVSETATFTIPALSGGGNRTANVSIMSTAKLCAPLPSPLGLTGTVN